MTRRVGSVLSLAGLVAAALLATAAPAPAIVPLTAIETRIGDHPGYVRVVVELVDGRLEINQAQLLKAEIFGDGITAIAISEPYVRTETPGAKAFGVVARVVQGRDRITLRITGGPRRFKYVRYRALREPERLVVDLWKARPPVGGAVVRDDGCLRLDRWSVGRGRFTVAGHARRWLFENHLAVTLRDGDGDVLRLVPVTLLRAPGPWNANGRYRVARSQPGTLEAWVGSAKDGGLECLVQVPVTLQPD